MIYMYSLVCFGDDALGVSNRFILPEHIVPFNHHRDSLHSPDTICETNNKRNKGWNHRLETTSKGDNNGCNNG